jgi:uncharacterized protein (DUF2345 family)
LTITAGTNINLNKQIDALDDTNPLSITPVPGGSVTFTAGNNVNLYKDLATYNGPVDITATTGTLNIAWDANRTHRIQTGSAPISVTTGGNLSTGTAPPTTFAAPDRSVLDPLNNDQKKEFLYNYIVDQLRPYVAFSTNGKLSLISTGGDVTVDAPIPSTTGEVAITAADAIVVNHKVFSNNQPITLTAGAGGITVNSTSDDYGIMSQLSSLTPPINVLIGNSPAIDSGSGPLTLRAVGDVWITTANGIATKGKLTIDTRSKIVRGTVSNPVTAYVPSEIELIADGGIVSFWARYSPKISASSLNGDIDLAVYNPDKLDITANTGSVYTGGNLGADTTIYAGNDIILDPVNMELRYGVMHLTAGRDVAFDYLYFVKSLDVIAGRDVNFNFTRGISQPSNFPSLWFEGGGVNVDAGRNISFNGDSAVYIGDTVTPYNRYGLTLKAQGNIDLRALQTFGPVNIESTLAATPVINLWEPVGPHITPTINPPGDKGVASFTLIAPASGSSITMAGVRAEGDVTINTGGTLTSSRNITSAIGNVVITASSQTIGGVDIGNQTALMQPGTVAPAISPGPTVAPPGLPMALTALPAQPPDVVNVSGSGIPGASGGGGAEQEIEPMRVAGTGSLSEIIPGEGEKADEEENKKILNFSGGRGVSQTADFGRK